MINSSEIGTSSYERMKVSHRKGKSVKIYVKKGNDKTFEGNIKLFSESSFQYEKRHKKGSCCGIVKATEKNIVEDKERIIEKDGGKFVDNMIVWTHAENTIHICAECGWIDSKKSNVKSEPKIKTTMLTMGEFKLFNNPSVLESMGIKNNNEPSEYEILKEIESIASEIDFEENYIED